MATNFDNPYSAKVIGLWDFRPTAETADTGLGDGIAQDGTPADDPTFDSGWMFSSAEGRGRLDVDDGDDQEFDLDEGSIVTRFRPFGDNGSETNTVVSRGVEQSADGTDGPGGGTGVDSGFFEIRVTNDGAVEVQHRDGGNEVTLSTADGFFAGGDFIKVVYAWSADKGPHLQVENETQGTSEVVSSDVTGLTLDVTTDTEQSFSIGGREATDDNFDQPFTGGIDYVAVLDKPVVGQGNGIVDGTAGDDVIDLAYTGDPEGDVIDGGDAIDPTLGPDDDVVDGGAGDDSISAGEGDDTVYAGSGNDTVDGEAGDDVLYGDGSAPGGGASGATREAFQWDLAPDPDDGGDVDNGDDLSGGFVQNTGTIDVTFSVLDETPAAGSDFSTQEQFVSNIDTGGPDANDNSALNSDLVDPTDAAAYQLEFSDPVSNVSFRVNDVDANGQVMVQAFAPNGDPITVNVAGGIGVTLSDSDGVAGDDTATGDGGHANPDNSVYSILVTIPGPVGRVVVDHSVVGTGDSEVSFTDVYFDVANADTGPDGDDSLTGGDGDDEIYGGGGDDTVDGGDGADSVDGGDGDDVINTRGDIGSNLPDRGFPSYDGLPAVPADGDIFDDRDTVDGGAGNDIILTGDDADVITGGTGDDSIDGGLDDDTISGGADNDLIVGGEGADSIDAGDGDDMVYGGLDPSFPDRLNIRDDGSDGPPDVEQTNGLDYIDGGAGNDTLYGQDDDDTILGGSGDDSIDGGIDNDLLEGGDGTDTLLGGQGNDTIEGDAGNDSIEGGIGADILSGGDDRDTFVGGDNGDQVDGGSGGDDFDTLDLRGLGAVGVVYTSEDREDGVAVIGSTGDVLTFEEIENVLIDEPLDPDGIVEGTFESDVIDVNYDGDPNGDFVDNDDALLPGQVGDDDIIVAKTGDDTVIAGLGDDLVAAGDGNDIVDSSFGEDTLLGGDGNDYLDGREDDDELHGGDGDDTLFGGDGNDVALGGEGNDFIATGSGDDTLEGGEGNDFADAFTGNDELSGGEGNDTLLGNDGDDTVSGGSGDDAVIGGAGDDDLTGGDGDDIILAGAGSDIATGGAGDDTLSSGGGSDELFGGDDQDVFYGTPGDVVVGGEGGVDFDTLIVNGPAEIDYVDDDPATEAGTVYYLDGDGVRTGDILTFSEIETVTIRILPGDGVVEGTEAGELIDVDYTGDPEGDRIDNFDGFDNITNTDLFSGTPNTFVELPGGPFTNDMRDAVLAGGGDDTVLGDLGDDVIYGGEGNDVLEGGLGRDDLIGEGGDDILRNTAGVSRMFGGEGNDTFEGGVQSDLMYGGEGDDRFIGNEGNDIIEGDGGNDTVIGGLGGDTVDGGEGDDSIDGGLGDDSLQGGGGSDTIDAGLGDNFVDAGTGDDSISGDDGDDTIYAGDGADTVIAGGGNDVVVAYDPAFTGVASIGRSPDSVDGGAGDDALAAGSGDDTIDGGDDEDTLYGGIGADLLSGDAGNDVVYGDSDISMEFAPDIDAALAIEPGDDTISGGEGDDTLYGEFGNDRIYGGEGADQVFGGDDRDVIAAGIGDTIEGGEGGDDFDTLIASGLAVIDYDESDPTGESGTVTYYNEDLTVAGTAEFSEIENALVIGGPTQTGGGPDGPSLQGVDGVVEGTDGDDVIDLDYMGDPEGDLVDGDDAVVPLVGEQDVIVAGGGNDSVRGEDDEDVILAGSGDDTVLGNGGGDAIDGGAGDDSLDGGAGRDIVVGGDGDDTISGSNDDADDGGDILSGQGDDDTFVNIGQGEVIIGGEDADGLDIDTLDLRGAAEAANPGGTLTVELDAGNPENGIVRFFDADGDETGTSEFREIEAIIPCFTPGTLIATPKGERRVEDLQVGDRVITRDNGIQDIKWIGTRQLDTKELAHAAHLNPILIREGALGNGLPERDMMVSPNHRVLVANDKTALYFEDREVLVAAKHLTGLEGVDVVEVSNVTYVHFMFDQHEVVLSDGAWTESFQPGDQTLAGMGNAQRTEIFELFPELKTREGLDAYAAARRSLKKHEARLLM